MVTEILEQVFGKEIDPALRGNYSLAFLDFEVRSNCHQVLRCLDFFLEPFRSRRIEPPKDFSLALLVDEPGLPSKAKRIFHKCEDPRSTGVCYSPTPARFLREDGNLYFRANERVFGVLWLEERQGLMIFDQDSVFAQQPPFFRIFVFVLTEILTSMNCVILHAASLESSKGGICLVGSSGAGKTTLLLGLLRTGRYSFLGDELCLAQRTKKGCRIGALTPMVHVPPRSLQYFDELRGCVHETDYSQEWKVYLDPRKTYGNCFRTLGTPRCLVFLEEAIRLPPVLEPIGPFEALNKAVENTLVPLTHEDFFQNLSIVSELIHQSKTFRFVRSSVLEESVCILDSVVEHL